MIKNRKSLSMCEAKKFIDKEEGKELLGFIKKFSKMKQKDAVEMRKKLEALELMKVDRTQISKIIELLPENAEDLNKIFTGLALDDEEARKILEIVKEFK